MFRGWSVDLLRIVFLTIGIVVTAAVSANIFLASAIIFPVLFALLVFDHHPGNVESVDLKIQRRAWVGEEIAVECTLKLSGSSAFINFELPLPRQFELVDGNNIHVFYKKRTTHEFRFELKMKVLRRGEYHLNQIRYTAYGFAGEFRKNSGAVEFASDLEVLPRVELMKKGNVRTFSKRHVPRQSTSRIGPPSTEFDSIRSYVHGDPLKTINWKATARSANGGSLMVNRYEREGLSTSLIVLDRGGYMRKGTLEVNPFESGIRAILSLSRMLLERGINTGFWYGQKFSSRYAYVLPSTDIENFQRIKKTILMGETLETMKSAIDPGSVFFHSLSGTAANVLLVTNLSSMNSVAVDYFMKYVSRFASNALILDILPYGIISNYHNSPVSALFGQQVLRKSSQKLYSTLPGNVRIESWDPFEEKLGGMIGRIARYMR